LRDTYKGKRPVKIQNTTVFEGEKIVVDVLIADSASAETTGPEFLRFRIIPEKVGVDGLLAGIKLAALNRVKAIVEREIVKACKDADQSQNRQ
jgi:hypothetical protein